MVAGPKTIAEPLVPIVCQKPLIPMVVFQLFIYWQIPPIFGIFFVEGGPASCSLINSAFSSPHLSHPKPKYKVKNHWKTIDTNGWHVKNNRKTIDTNGWHVKNHRQQLFTSKQNHWKTIDHNGFFEEKKLSTFHRAQKSTIVVVYMHLTAVYRLWKGGNMNQIWAFNNPQ